MSDTDDTDDYEGDDVGPPQPADPAAADADLTREEDVDDEPAPRTRRGERTFSSAARAAFAAASKKVAASLAAEDDDEDEDAAEPPRVDGEPASRERAREQRTAASVGVAQPAPGAAPAPEQRERTPPAPSLDPAVAQLREQWASRNAELDRREQELAARAASLDEAAVRERYLENPEATLIDLVKRYSGLTTDDEVTEELGDLIVSLSAKVTKGQLDPMVSNRLDAKRTKRYVLAQKDALRRREEASTKTQTAEQQRAAIREAQQQLSAAIASAVEQPEAGAAGAPYRTASQPATPRYPFLALEPNAGEIVFELIEARFKKDGTTLSWTDAAKEADSYLNKNARAYFDKRRHLLDSTKPATSGPTEPIEKTAPGDLTGIRRSRGITNAATATSPTSQPAPPTGKWDPEAHRKATKLKMRSAFARPASEEPSE